MSPGELGIFCCTSKLCLFLSPNQTQQKLVAQHYFVSRTILTCEVFSSKRIEKLQFKLQKLIKKLKTLKIMMKKKIYI